MKKIALFDSEKDLIDLTRKSNELNKAIENIVQDTRNYLRSKDLDIYKWRIHEEYPGDDHVKFVLKKMEEQIDKLAIEKEMVDARIVNWLKNICGF